MSSPAFDRPPQAQNQRYHMILLAENPIGYRNLLQLSSKSFLDGYYYTVPSVTHKELLYALDAGVRVIGASSLGALRAVELAPFGRDGAGKVFEAYRSGTLDGDDEVALR